MIDWTRDEIEQIKNEYQNGVPIREISKRHYVSRPTIGELLIKEGVRTKQIRRWSRETVRAIMYDWNSMMPLKEIAEKHGFQNTRSLSRFAFQYRQANYPFIVRRRIWRKD